MSELILREGSENANIHRPNVLIEIVLNTSIWTASHIPELKPEMAEVNHSLNSYAKTGGSLWLLH